MDAKISPFPPKGGIIKTDLTDVTNYPALDEYLMDERIEETIKKDMDDEVLNRTFYVNYPVFARKCWSGNHVPTYADSLGFPFKKG